jgi:hypothetical protein
VFESASSALPWLITLAALLGIVAVYFVFVRKKNC